LFRHHRTVQLSGCTNNQDAASKDGEHLRALIERDDPSAVAWLTRLIDGFDAIDITVR
jgi:hypothetical protein